MRNVVRNLATLALLTYTALPASASPSEDLAFEVGEINHDKTSGWIVERLMTLKISDQCFAKVLDKKNSALSKIASDARSIERYAKVITGDEWSHIESQGANNKAANRAIVDKAIDDFKPKFHVTVNLEGEDCDAGGNALWLKYTGSALQSLVQYPPRSKQMTITINVTSRTKDVKAEVGKDGSTLVVTGARDVEPVGWSDTIGKALKRHSTND
jgi:hypothetical protein